MAPKRPRTGDDAEAEDGFPAARRSRRIATIHAIDYKSTQRTSSRPAESGRAARPRALTAPSADAETEPPPSSPVPSSSNPESESSSLPSHREHVTGGEPALHEQMQLVATPASSPEYRRVLERRRGSSVTWSVLIPSSPFPPPRAVTSDGIGALVPLGAVFGTAAEAAKAADKALIAMWGPRNASAHLNFPLVEYGGEAVQRYGPELSTYLLKLCEDGKAARHKAKARDEAERYVKNLGESHVSRRLARSIRRMKSAPDFVDPHAACGVCPACRQVRWLGEKKLTKCISNPWD